MSQRRPKDRSHWGDAAFKAMHDKPITREVLHKALQEPTKRERIKELEAENARLRSVPDGLQRPDADFLRSLPGDQMTEDRYWIGWTDALDQVRAALAPEVK